MSSSSPVREYLSSPLAHRDANIAHSLRSPPMGKRRARPGFTPEETRAKRRDMLAQRARERRQQTHRNGRGGDDEMMRIVFLAEQKREEKRLAMEADLYQASFEDEEELLRETEMRR